ncbi:putative isomerase [Dongia mobilis]|uniref:Putative isomerase n=1 Tax=Dongia mobilis TaxID=578943 RepID=A0A4R6WVZ8_9PROT|nr:trehalase family glycosidase [Dongia mobilis]TDQ84214.1 putative isomerase [Dongia mobilis]
MSSRYPALAPARHWNTWRSEYPAQMMHLPLGLTVTLCAYSGAANSFTDFPANAGGITYGPRDVGAAQVAFTARHHGTTVEFEWDRPAGDGSAGLGLRGSWRNTENGEWGLRFWLQPVFEVADRPDLVWRYDEASGVLSSEIDGTHVAVIGDAKPLMATFHESRAALADEYRVKGYFYLASRGVEGRVPALRYNFDETPTMRFAVGLGQSAAAALDQARRTLAAPAPADLPVRQAGRDGGSLDAIRDIVGWNSVHDFINDWPYMSLSRAWVAQKFGGFGLWLDDICYHALGTALFDAEMAKESIRAVLATETPEGNLACLITGNDAWIDRSQLPVCSLVIWKIWQHTGDDSLVAPSFRRLLKNHDWWFARRSGAPKNSPVAGLMGWGTSANVGSGLYKGTKLGAKNESTMDNSPLHDETVFDAATGCLDAVDVALNSALVVDAEVLALFADRLGEAAISTRLRARAADLRRRIHADLWDDTRRVFANRRWSGKFVQPLAPTSFYPLLADAADAAQRDGLVRILDDPNKFGGEWRLPSITRDDPAYHDNVYWRGRAWPPLNYLTYQGLKRAGLDRAAGTLAADSQMLFAQAWARRQCPENFNAETGQADDQPDTDLFYGWGLLLPLIAVNEIIDVTPWHGWELTHHPGDWRLGPVNAFGRQAVIVAEGGVLTLSLDGGRVFAIDIPGRFRHLEISGSRLVLEPPVSGGTIRLGRKVARALYGGAALAAVAAGGDHVITLPPVAQPQKLEIEFAS